MNILDAFQFHGIPTRQKTATEWESPCPGCGGKDRCIIWPFHETGTGGRFTCRQCEEKGDLIDFLRKFEGLSYKDACEKAGKTKDSLAGREKGQSKGQGTNKAISFPARQKELYSPPPQWIEQAGLFLRDCQTEQGFTEADMEESIKKIACERFLPPDYCLAVGIAWNNRDRWFKPGLWGLDSPKKIWLPKGIVIATRRKAGVIGLLIRKQDNKQPRYLQVKGGAVDVPYIPKICRNKPVFILEGALDAALLALYAGDICTAIAMGGTCKAVDAETMAFIQAASLIIASPDNDPAGKEAWLQWHKLWPTANPYLAIGAKDIGEMHKLAMSLEYEKRDSIPTARQWAQHAIEYTRKAINAL